MYEASSRGIVTAVLSGAAGAFKRDASELIERHPRYENGGGYLLLGSFYFVAPWPVADPARGQALLEQAVRVAPTSRRNRYFAGVGAFRLKDWPRAMTHLVAVADGTCETPTERDLCAFVTAESARVAPIAAARARDARAP